MRNWKEEAGGNEFPSAMRGTPEVDPNWREPDGRGQDGQGDDQPIYPAWEASYGDLDPRDSDRQPEPPQELGEGGRVGPRVVQGSDDREKITEPGRYPGTAIAWLLAETTDQAGEKVVLGGTGFYISSRMIVTAGHNLFAQKADYFGKMSRCKVFRDHHSTSMSNPNAIVDAADFKIAPEWESSASEPEDYAALLVPQEAACSEHLGIKNLSDGEFDQLITDKDPFTISGHPLNVPEVPEEHRKPNGTMWQHSAALGVHTSDQFQYAIDTTKGQSGAPICRDFGGDEGWMAVGIHNYGGQEYNSGSRINSSVWDQLLKWFNEYGL